MAKDVTRILTAERLALLREKFNNQELLDLARSNFGTRYAPAALFVEPLIAHFYEDGATTAHADRERTVIALLAAEQSNAEMATHFYWGLMVGLSPKDIAEVLLLVYGYSGANEFNNAIAIYEGCLDALAVQPDDQIDTISCVVTVSAVAKGTYTPPSEA